MRFSHLSVQCPGGGSLPRTVSLIVPESPVGPRNAISPGHQSQEIKECLLCELCVPAGFSELVVEHRTRCTCQLLQGC